MKKKQFLLIIGLLLTNLCMYGQLLELTSPSFSNSGEHLIDFYVDDAPSDFFRILNTTTLNNRFIAGLWGHNETDPRTSFQIIASTSSLNDVSSSPRALMNFDARMCEGGEPSNSSSIANRFLFSWTSYLEYKMVLSAEGNLGIGSTNPQAKVHVSDGDIYIEDIDRGIIMKDVADPNKCYRITVVDGVLVTTLLPECP